MREGRAIFIIIIMIIIISAICKSFYDLITLQVRELVTKKKKKKEGS